MTRLFDCYVAVDWSAANTPRLGKDSIWIAAISDEGRAPGHVCENIPTRSAAMARLEQVFAAGLSRGSRILAGFDFAFGYPAGFAVKLLGTDNWRAVWRRLCDEITDDDQNRSNRFEVGSRLNEALGSPLFWGKPHQHRGRHAHLPARRPGGGVIGERRVAERHVKSAKSVFQLAYNGAVGSQTLLGLPRLEALCHRLDAQVRVWPFETDFADNLPAGPAVTIAEIYPTLFLRGAVSGEVKDAAQVKSVVRSLMERDRAGSLAPLLAPPPGTTPEERSVMLREEGSIVGAGVL